MDRATRTLVGSLMRRTAPVLLSQMGLTAALCFLLRDVELALGHRGFRPPGDWRTLLPTDSEEFLMSLLLTGVNAFVAGGAVLLLHSDAKRLKVGLPLRVFLLPMSYRRIVLAHMLFGVAAVAGAVSVACIGSEWALESPIPWWMPVLLCVGGYAALQAWAFTLAERRATIALGSLAVLVGAFALAVRVEAVGTFVTRSSPFTLFLCVGAFVAGCCMWAVWFGRDLRYSTFDVRPRGASRVRDRARFKSAFGAQLWYEWRRVGWVLPSIATGGLIAFFVGMPIAVALFTGSNVTGESSWVGYTDFFSVQWESSVHMVVTALQTTAVGSSVLAGAYALLVSGEWGGGSTFLPARPLRTSRMASARIVVMFLSALLTSVSMVVLTLLLAWVVGVESAWTELVRYLHFGYEHVPEPLIVAFFGGSLFAALWVGLWIGECAVVGAVYAVPAAVLLGIAWLIGLVWDGVPAVAFAERAAIWLGSLACVIAAGGVAAYAYVASLVPGRRIALAVAIYGVYAAIFIYYGLNFRPASIQDVVVFQDWAIPFPHPIDWPLWLGLSVLPVVPLFSYPALLARWRTT